MKLKDKNKYMGDDHSPESQHNDWRYTIIDDAQSQVTLNLKQ